MGIAKGTARRAKDYASFLLCVAVMFPLIVLLTLVLFGFRVLRDLCRVLWNLVRDLLLVVWMRNWDVAERDFKATCKFIATGWRCLRAQEEADAA